MKPQTCAVCEKPVKRGTGMHYGRRLIHRDCLGTAKVQHWRLDRKQAYKYGGRGLTAHRRPAK